MINLMRKISFKIMFLLICCLLGAGLILGAVAVMQINAMGRANLEALEQKLRDDYDLMLKNQIESAVSIVEAIYEKRNELGEERAYAEAADVIRSISYGESGYVFVYDSAGTTVVLLGNDLEGTNRWDLKDAFGNYIIRDIVNAAQNGDGFSTYYYPKPGETEALPKRAYNQYFAPYDWTLGTGNYIDDIDKVIKEEEENIATVIFNIIRIILIIDAGIILVSIFIAWLIGKRISRPLEILVEKVSLIADGNLDVVFDIKSKDETRTLSDALGRMEIQLNRIITNIIEITLKINSSAQQVAESAAQVASGSSEQAANAEEISASMEQLVSNIHQNTDNSRESNKIVGKAAEEADAGGHAVEASVEMMTLIAGKIKVIEEIARNTNLLALNASIEAARAGGGRKRLFGCSNRG